MSSRYLTFNIHRSPKTTFIKSLGYNSFHPLYNVTQSNFYHLFETLQSYPFRSLSCTTTRRLYRNVRVSLSSVLALALPSCHDQSEKLNFSNGFQGPSQSSSPCCTTLVSLVYHPCAGQNPAFGTFHWWFSLAGILFSRYPLPFKNHCLYVSLSLRLIWPLYFKITICYVSRLPLPFPDLYFSNQFTTL